MKERPRRLRPSRLILIGSVSALVAVAALAALVALPYSTSLISEEAPADALRSPNPGFRLGRLAWPVTTLSSAQELDPFRRAFRARCGDSQGVEAAVCVSSGLARAFPNGRAPSDFVDPGFEPVAHQERHLAGHPGHCMNRSAIMAAELLAAGVPARVVQILSEEGVGHTLVEVWDEEAGWTLVDPTFGLILSGTRGSTSAWALVSKTESVGWLPAGEAPQGGEEPLPVGAWAGGTALYPEPWLYHRTGARLAPWPFRARYVSIGTRRFIYGPAQRLLVVVTSVAGVAAAGSFLWILVPWCLRRRSSPDAVRS